MTICASSRIPDAIVMGTDTLVTSFMGVKIDGRDCVGVRNRGHMEKLWQVGKGPVGLACCGAAALCGHSIASLVHEFNRSVNGDVVATDLLMPLRQFFEGWYGKADSNLETRDGFGLLLAEYRSLSGKGYSIQWHTTIAAASWDETVHDDFEPKFFGYSNDIKRLLWGNGAPQVAAFHQMSSSEAVDFTYWALQVQTGASRFSEFPVPLCGEPIHIAVLSKDGFRLINRMRWWAYGD